MGIDEQGHKLNFPGDESKVHKKKTSSKFIGVSCDKNKSKWKAQRWRKCEKNSIYNEAYHNEEETAHESDTLVRKLTKNCKQNLKLNFTDHKIEFSNVIDFIGVGSKKKCLGWRAQKQNKHE